MAAHVPDSVPITDATTTSEDDQSSCFSFVLHLTDEEKQIEQYLNQRLNKPRGRLFDTVNERMDRFEPLAKSVERLLAMKELEPHMDDIMRLKATRMVKQFRNRKAQVQSGYFGNIPMFGILSAVDEFGKKLETGYAELKTRISTEWRERKLAAAYLRELHAKQDELKKQKEEIERVTADLQSAYKSVRTQVQFGQYICQNRDENGFLMAEVDDNPNYPIIYIDVSGNVKGKQAQGSYGSIHHAWTSPDRSESSEMFAVKVPRDHRTGQNELAREGEIWSFLQIPVPHPNILEFCGTCSIGATFTGLLSPWVPDSRNWRECLFEFEEAQHLVFVEQIADAVSYMHDRIVLHGDVKLSNVIISRNPLKTLLCDFGFSLRRNLDSTRESVRGSGSGPHTSPEAYDGIRKTFAADTWSFGVCIMHVLMKKLPFEERVRDAKDIREEYNKLFVVENLRPSMPLGLTSPGVLAWSIGLACARNSVPDRPPMKEIHLAMKDLVAGRESMASSWLDRWKCQDANGRA